MAYFDEFRLRSFIYFSDTHRAMTGSVPFEEALAARLSLFNPSLSQVQDCLEKRPPRYQFPLQIHAIDWFPIGILHMELQEKVLFMLSLLIKRVSLTQFLMCNCK